MKSFNEWLENKINEISNNEFDAEKTKCDKCGATGRNNFIKHKKINSGPNGTITRVKCKKCRGYLNLDLIK